MDFQRIYQKRPLYFLSHFPAVAVVGQRQRGKTTLVHTHSVDEDYPHNEQVRVTSFERIFFHLEQQGLLQY